MHTTFDLTDQVVAVTGATRGLGLCIARQFLRAGAFVVINGPSAEETAEAVRVLGAPGSRLVGASSDVASPEAAGDLVATAVSAFGRLDHLICNAGIAISKPAIDYAPAEWDRVLGVNLRGAFLPAQVAARYWIESARPGSVTMTSSITGSAGVPNLAPYSASKGAVNQLARSLAVEWARQSIRVNAVAPGYIAAGPTSHHGSGLFESEPTDLLTPMGRKATPEEAAAPFLFLASPGAAYVTGSILAVDGGYTAQ